MRSWRAWKCRSSTDPSPAQPRARHSAHQQDQPVQHNDYPAPEHEVEALIADPDTIGLQFRLIDKFGDNGIVSVMILSPAQDGEETLEIINWVMSCRVFGRQLEDEVMNIAVDAVQRRNVKNLRASSSRPRRTA